MKIKTNSIETNYVIEGEGPWVTMSHSLACNLSMWDEQAKLLTRKFKVLRYDTRGHGGSSMRAMKPLLNAYGLPGGTLRPPRLPITPAELEKVIADTVKLDLPGLPPLKEPR